jgi:MFS transporter, FSR family, fosmidomycin resistance protein
MKNRQVLLLSIAHTVMDINQGALPALLPFLIARHNLSYAAAAGMVFAANFSSSLVQPLFGYFADRISKSWLIPAGLLVGGTGFALIGIIPNYWMMFSAVALSGLGIAAFHPEAARLVNLAAGRNAGTGMSLFATGGYLGFAIGPLFITALLTLWGLKGTLFLMVPIAVMAWVLGGRNSPLLALRPGKQEPGTADPAHKGQDAWAPFSRLAVAIIGRSIIFVGLNTFLPLYWVNVLHQSKSAGGTALTILFTGGVAGSLLGGRFADRFGYRLTVRSTLIAIMFTLPAIVFIQNVPLLTALLAPLGFLLFASFSPLVVMGQQYLPNRVGFASGITLGLAVTAGGVAAPLLGRIADLYGIRVALMALVFLPIVPTSLAFTLPQPVRRVYQDQMK